MTPLTIKTLGLALVASAAVAAPAGAATLQGDPRGGLRYVAQPGELNDVTVEWREDELRLKDPNAPIELRQQGVTAEKIGDHEVRIRPAVKITVDTGDGADRVRVTGVRTDGVSVVLGDGDDALDGGPGRDFAEGGLGEDTLIGFEGDDVLVGGGGRDVLDGREGDDTLFADGDFVADAIYGREGADTATVEPGEAADASVETVDRAAFLPILREAGEPEPVRAAVARRRTALEPHAVPAAGVTGGTIALRSAGRTIGRARWSEGDDAVTIRIDRRAARRVRRDGRLDVRAVHTFAGLESQLRVAERVRLVRESAGVRATPAE